MSSHSTYFLPAGHTLTITAHHVVGLDLKPYVEWRLEERDEVGMFVGYCAMGTREFVEDALRARQGNV
jgi:hypothetical protein